MSIVDKFYEILPDHIVFKILNFKPHNNALLIKEDIEDIGHKYKDYYSQLFVYNRLLHKGRRKAIQRKNELDKKIKLAHLERQELISIILEQQMLCHDSYFCKSLTFSNTLDNCYDDDDFDILKYSNYTFKCPHYENIKNIENNKRKCEIKIKDYEIEKISVDKNMNMFLNMKIEDVYEISDIV